jgi:hypothetical protein
MRNYFNHITAFCVSLLLFSASLLLGSCKKFLDIGPQPSSLTEENAFIDSATATGTVLALYSTVGNTNPQNNSLPFNIVKYGMMSADDAYFLTNSTFDNFKNNTLGAGGDLASFWNNLYQIIGRANYIVKNLNNNTALSTSVRNQLMGEAKFMRAWCYFYLTNFFGAVPLVTTTEAVENAKLPRSPQPQVYELISSDLNEAKTLLSNNYVSVDRARANKKVATAMLARVYFYQQKWTDAEREAGEVIADNNYKIKTNPDSVFEKSSPELILQIANSTGVTSWGGEFIPASATPNVVLYDTLANTFEANDKRKTSWTKPISYGGITYYYPHKFKQRSGSAGNEYHVMLRLAEMYLIRSEARANLNNIEGAVDDINVIRDRAGLDLLEDTITKDELISLLEHERWVELFTEWSDRWFNLKRTGRADIVLKLIKPQWQSFQQLYPVPQNERQVNPNLNPDNPGY